MKVEYPVASVRNIVKTVFVHPFIAFVFRLISSFHKVTNCRRPKQENTLVFVSGFRSLAETHPLHGKASSSSQIRECLAVTLLNHSNIDEKTILNATSGLLTHADAQQGGKEELNLINIPKTRLENIYQVTDRLCAL